MPPIYWTYYRHQVFIYGEKFNPLAHVVQANKDYMKGLITWTEFEAIMLDMYRHEQIMNWRLMNEVICD